MNPVYRHNDPVANPSIKLMLAGIVLGCVVGTILLPVTLPAVVLQEARLLFKRVRNG